MKQDSSFWDLKFELHKSFTEVVNAYFEVYGTNDTGDIDLKYFTAQHTRGSEVLMGRLRTAMLQAQRVWLEDDDGKVRYIKHLFADPVGLEVNMEEFMWVKLRSVTI